MELSKLSTLCQIEVTNMILTTYDKDLYEKTLKEDAREEIIAELNQLTKYLLKAKRYNDLERAAEDIEYQKKLLKEFGIE
jgi:regulator of sirC expression with transglutaminase-like and TPR domain